jgi:hypothetical protein
MRLRFLLAALVTAAGAAFILAAANPAGATGSGNSGSSGSSGAGDCIAHHPNYIEGVFEVHYSAGCSGHDEPELDPLSDHAGSARDLTWTVVLPSDNTTTVDSVGPTFWFGGTVTDPNSLFHQGFVELQFYPNALVTNCTPNGGFVLKHVPGDYSVCSPVWTLTQTGTPGIFHEPAGFNARLNDDTSGSGPLVMKAGDTVSIHWFTTAAQDGFHVTVTDFRTGHAGTIVLNPKKDGPMMPAFDTQTLGNALGWGIVNDAPNSFVWEIGHTSDFSSPAAQFCLPGNPICDSYNGPSWAGQLPIQIKSVTFGDGSTAQHWAVVSDFGGKAEINDNCGAANYGKPFCIYPWFQLGPSGFHYGGADFPDTTNDFGQADQFFQTLDCGGPFGPNSTYCANQIQ